ncbi:hypothetical protein [Formosa algae]|uniref:Uncharacterized protein n=1 Tax=Formosa algae TaxID=225843 RepID=A0A9X1CAN7_9FLAO|nr:hypothetical protein [Formosa algae]MBP1839207.1 hypothetical protein [Formosa algae]MDQ0333984.1 hypothetical protein [Formosa algae]OEI79714.1 hypothetical protein AST99_13280 [Formosa algae]
MSSILISKHHTAPESIKKEALEALSFYPELKDVEIDIRFKKEIKKSTMQAQPQFGSLLKGKMGRRYVIFISKKIKISNTEFSTKSIPSKVIVGWLGHELGHICDYQNRTTFGLIIFGFKYLFSEKFIKEAERNADSFAIVHGMEDYIIETKNFILDNANIPESYKNRIKRFYLSPEEIMLLIDERDKALEID